MSIGCSAGDFPPLEWASKHTLILPFCGRASCTAEQRATQNFKLFVALCTPAPPAAGSEWPWTHLTIHYKNQTVQLGRSDCKDLPCASVIRVHNAGFFERVMSAGHLGLAESFMAGWFTFEKGGPYELVGFVVKHRLDQRVKVHATAGRKNGWGSACTTGVLLTCALVCVSGRRVCSCRLQPNCVCCSSICTTRSKVMRTCWMCTTALQKTCIAKCSVCDPLLSSRPCPFVHCD
jgi:hypothetical protein